MWRRTLSLLMRAAVVLASATDAPAAVPSDPAASAPKEPENFSVAENGPVMQEAIARARATLPDFLKLAERPRRGMSAFAVKYGLPTPTGVEYVWATFIKRIGARVLARIDVDVRWSNDVQDGDVVFVDIPDIVDWMYVDRDRMIGNTTLCALDVVTPSDKRRALRERMRLDCSWLAPTSLR